MRSSGTSADRVAAATLLVQQSPAANLAQLDALLGMVSGKGHRDTAAAVDALRERFAYAGRRAGDQRPLASGASDVAAPGDRRMKRPGQQQPLHAREAPHRTNSPALWQK